MEAKNAEIITIGEEYSVCREAVTSADVIAVLLGRVGITQKSRYYVDFDDEEICAAVTESIERYDVTVITGSSVDFSHRMTGLLSRVLGVDPVSDVTLYSCMKSYAKKHESFLTEEAEKYAMLPRGASAFSCESVPISGYAFVRDGKTVVVLPGNPQFVSLICDQCLEKFFEYCAVDRRAVRRIDLIGCKPAEANAEAERIESRHPGVRVAVHTLIAETMLEITAPGAGADREEALVEAAEKDVMQGFLSEKIYGADTDLPTEIVRMLAKKKYTLSTAESCTGGLVAKLITDVPGASAVFPGSVVSYSNAIKTNVLGVDPEVLGEYGAVSHRVAIQMAEGVRRIMGTDWGIGITGIAGPGGGTPEKPVGLVYLAIASSRRSRVLKFNVDGDRDNVRYTVAYYALRELLTRMINHDRRRGGSTNDPKGE